MGQIEAVWEEMKMVVFSRTAVVDKGKTVAMPTVMTVTAGAESILFLLTVPEAVVLTLQMEQERSKNALSW